MNLTSWIDGQREVPYRHVVDSLTGQAIGEQGTLLPPRRGYFFVFVYLNLVQGDIMGGPDSFLSALTSPISR